jgi:hypothetical protein
LRRVSLLETLFVGGTITKGGSGRVKMAQPNAIFVSFLKRYLNAVFTIPARP